MLTRETERRDNQMGHSRSLLRPFHGMVRRRIHTRKAALEKGLAVAGISSRTSSPLLTPSSIPHC